MSGEVTHYLYQLFLFPFSFWSLYFFRDKIYYNQTIKVFVKKIGTHYDQFMLIYVKNYDNISWPSLLLNPSIYLSLHSLPSYFKMYSLNMSLIQVALIFTLVTFPGLGWNSWQGNIELHCQNSKLISWARYFRKILRYSRAWFLSSINFQLSSSNSLVFTSEEPLLLKPQWHSLAKKPKSSFLSEPLGLSAPLLKLTSSLLRGILPPLVFRDILHP